MIKNSPKYPLTGGIFLLLKDEGIIQQQLDFILVAL